MAQLPVIVDQNVFASVKFRQEGYAWRVTGPYPIKNRLFPQRPWRDRAIGIIYSGRAVIREYAIYITKLLSIAFGGWAALSWFLTSTVSTCVEFGSVWRSKRCVKIRDENVEPDVRRTLLAIFMIMKSMSDASMFETVLVATYFPW